MDSGGGTLQLFVQQLALALQPLKAAVADLSSFRTFLYRLGWDVKSLPPEYTALGARVDGILVGLQGLGDNPQPAQLLALLDNVKALYVAVNGIASAPQGVDASAFLAEIGRSVFELLLADYLDSAFPDVHATLRTLGILVEQYQDASDGRPAVLLTRFQWDQIPKILGDPSSIPALVYGWGTDDLDFHRLAGDLLELFIALNLPAYLGRVDEGLAQGFLDSTDDPTVSIAWGLNIPVLADNIGGTEIELGLALLELPPQGGKLAGVILQPLVPSAVGTSYDITDTLKLTLRAGTDVAQTLGVMVRPGDLLVKYPFQPGTALPDAGFGVTLTYAPPSPTVLLGEPSATRLSVQGATSALEIDTKQDGIELKGSAALKGLNVIIAAHDQDSFLSSLAGGQNATIPIPLTIGWSSRSGVSFAGGAGLTLTQSANLRLGPITVQQVNFGLRSTAGSGRPPDLIVQAGVSIGANIGPVVASVSNVGLQLTITFEDGNAGPFDFTVGFMPPSGVGLAIDAAGVTGGGFLAHDDTKHEYSGVLQLQFINLALQAFGLITTQVAGGPGYSLLALVDAEFPPIQLGWGFTLDGVGGLLAVHRTASTDALHAALKAGQLSSILFPKSAITNAPVILGQLDTLFPTAPGRFLFGPMALIGWGSPRMLVARIAVVIELPEPIKVVLLSRIELRVPDETTPAVRVNMDALGILDLGKDELSFDAVLFDSKLVDFTLSGAMALRAEWGSPEHSEFVLAIGGVHPRFTPPPDFPQLQRVTIDMPSGHIAKLRLAAYLAVTSNTIQLGANLDFYLGASEFNVSGHLGFDALLHRDPFRFTSDISGKVAITAGGDDIASVDLEGTFSGPKPYHLAGQFKIHIVFFDVGVSFDYSWGGDLLAVLAPVVDLAGILSTAAADLNNWNALLPSGVLPFVTARQIDDTSVLLAHPLGRPEVRERIVPLGLAITRFGESVPSGANTFTFNALHVGTGTITPDTLQDDFAPAQFFELTDEEKLERPSFERHDAGVRMAAPPVTSGTPVPKTAAYETFFVDTPGALPREDSGVPSAPPSLDDLQIVVQFGAAGRAARRSAGRRYQIQGNPIRVTQQAFVLADRITMAPSGIGPTTGGTFSDMRALLAGNRALQILATHEIAAN
jgi:hypothetical protein